MRDTTFTAEERGQIRKAANEAVANTRRIHQNWHWDTAKTNCPWGCGDGSGIVGR